MPLAERSLLRKQVRRRRSQLSKRHQAAAADLIARCLQRHALIGQAKHIALYMASDGELSLQNFISWCWQRDIATYLPRFNPSLSGHLTFILYTTKTLTTINQYGITEPALGYKNAICFKAIDILLVPIVAFDQYGNRLGRGKGCYDRLLADWNKDEFNPYPIGVAHDIQKVTKIPSKQWDVPLPEIITPKKYWKFN